MPTVEEMNDVAPALQASRSGPRKAAVRKKPWCVQYSERHIQGGRTEGWCLVAGNYEPNEGANNVPTTCGLFVILPGNFERRQPTCAECVDLLDRSERAQPEATTTRRRK